MDDNRDHQVPSPQVIRMFKEYPGIILKYTLGQAKETFDKEKHVKKTYPLYEFHLKPVEAHLKPETVAFLKEEEVMLKRERKTAAQNQAETIRARTFVLFFLLLLSAILWLIQL
jgi:hypothetical protein